MTYLGQHLWILVAAIGGIAIAVLAAIVAVHERRWRALAGRGGASADSLLVALKRLGAAERELAAIAPRLEALETVGAAAVQKIGFLRFNPFPDTGGNQSFALALLDQSNTGVVISSLYTREGVRVYAKAVQAGASRHPLSDEETHVLRQAMEHSPIHAS